MRYRIDLDPFSYYQTILIRDKKRQYKIIGKVYHLGYSKLHPVEVFNQLPTTMKNESISHYLKTGEVMITDGVVTYIHSPHGFYKK